MQYAHILWIALGAFLLSACTHDFDVFKPRPDAGPDGSVQTSSMDPSADPLSDPESEGEN